MPKQTTAFEETLTLTATMLKDIDTFITQPESRQADLLVERNFPVEDHIVLNWLIKHDLFEGVVMHLTLLNTDLYENLGTADAALSAAEEVFGEFSISWKGAQYILHVVRGA